MISRIAIALGLCFGALVVALAVEPRSETVSTTAIEQQSLSEPKRVAAGGSLGVGSCSASACHGGAVEVGKPWQSAYTVWATEDRHSQAYAVLYEPLAKQIVANLDHLENRSQSKPYHDRRCLGCHSLALPDSPTAVNLADGVGCEACHGPAEKWLVPHTQDAWAKQPFDEQGRKPGMLDTKQLVPRVETCVECHVGAGPRSDGAMRDVNHDLIAAGHPRLTFELTSHLRAMPPHWSTQDDAAQAWAIGQLATTRAALELLADRATAEPARPWPEFSELDCYGCHQQLSSKLPHSELSVRWNPWNTALLKIPSHLSGKASENLPKIESTMSRFAPEREQAATEAHAASADLAAMLAALTDGTHPHISPQKLAAKIIDTADPRHWDQATQACLALEACSRAMRVAGKQNAPVPDDFDKQLRQLREELRFTLAVNPLTKKPITDADGHPAYYNSPHNYPVEKVRATLQALRAMLH